MTSTSEVTLAELNAADAERASRLFASCCGASRWVAGMLARRPFASLDELLADAESVWWDLRPDDWLEAFSHHPRIGERHAAVRQDERAAGWSGGEQRGVASAGNDVKDALARGNQEYERRFGHIYLVCATGKSAEELLKILESRLGNDPEAELRVAAGEQAKITALRLRKLVRAS